MKSQNQIAIIAKTILTHLKDSGQIDLLGEVVDLLRSSDEYKHSKNHVILTSAVALDSTELKGITAYLDKTVGDSYLLVKNVDASLVGGFTLQVNDTFIDASVLGKINLVSNKLSAKD